MTRYYPTAMRSHDDQVNLALMGGSQDLISGRTRADAHLRFAPEVGVVGHGVPQALATVSQKLFGVRKGRGLKLLEYVQQRELGVVFFGHRKRVG